MNWRQVLESLNQMPEEQKDMVATIFDPEIMDEIYVDHIEVEDDNTRHIVLKAD